MADYLYEVIDVSKHNGVVDFKKVKAAGIKGVIVRLGWAGYDGKIFDNGGYDSLFEKNVSNAIKAGLEVGIYVYSYTKNPDAARVCARECVEWAKKFPLKITLPIAFDIEETNDKCLVNQGKDGLANTTIAFLDEIKKLGYYGVFYTYTSFANAYLNMNKLVNYDFWLADYRAENIARTQAKRDFGMWQYIGEHGKCNGITGACDRNYVYVDYPVEIAKRFLNGLWWNPPTGGDV